MGSQEIHTHRVTLIHPYLNGHNEVAAVLEEVLSIESDDTGLIGLSHICKEQQLLFSGVDRV